MIRIDDRVDRDIYFGRGTRADWEGPLVDTIDLAQSLRLPKTSYHTEGIEEIEELARMEGWDLRFVQLSAGKFSSRYSGIEIPGGYLSLEFLCPSTLHVSGMAPKEHTPIILPLKIGRAFRYRNRTVRETDAIIVQDGEEADFVIEGELHFAAIYLTEALREEIRRGAFGPAGTTLGDGLPSVLSGPSVAQIKRIISDLLLAEATEPVSQDPIIGLQKAADNITLQLVTAISQQSALSAGILEQDARNGQACARSARDFMEANRHRPLALSDVSAELGVSVRTLQYAFQDRYGISPAKYHALMRLNGAHRDLKLSDPLETSVTEVATSWGFYHFGRFSKTFRAQFDELPSQTLAGKRTSLFWDRRGQPLQRRWRSTDGRAFKPKPGPANPGRCLSA